MTPARRNTGPSVTLNGKTLAWIASLLGVLYALNRPVQAFNSLSASVDKLAGAVSRIDITQTDQAKTIDQLRVDVAGIKAQLATQAQDKK